ncbi:hypothetical protein J2W31_003761 [Variovorax boronicumulans]|uniref:Uncharacterized protein n=1 Tax=Variovorax boronicumulans TaxID=436515 RepID=A0AAW8CWL6_9BURK|nr:hypothetical protein [Variovorax boronicumulans]
MSSFKVENIDTAIIYSVNAIPADIPARYTREGYEISWHPLFAFTLWADKDNNSLVDHVVLRLDGSFQTHAEAQDFVEQTLAQFLRVNGSDTTTRCGTHCSPGGRAC